MFDPATPTADPVAYDDSVEVIQPDEQQTVDEIGASMMRIAAIMNDRYRHATRPVHAKSHGLLKAELQISPDLPDALRQGLFAVPNTLPVIIRFSTTPGDILPDTISTPRAMALKILTPANMEMLPSHAGHHTQDFVLVNSKTFLAPDVKGFLKQQLLIEKNANDSELFKKVVSNVARGTNAALGVVGADSETLSQLGHPETHILGETFGSTAALRFGKYIAKIAVIPDSENLKTLTGKHVPMHGNFSALKDDIVEFFQTQTAIWTLAVQLCTDLKSMPVEDPSIPWPEDASPYRPVAKIIARPQNAYSPERRVFVDELLSFNPWHALAAHRPLGNIMRARRPVYQASSSFRHKMNGRSVIEPKSINELPD